MEPGLHALACTRCGAPLDPGSATVGSVVRCRHCAQPHLWVAPGRVEAQTPRPRSPTASSPFPAVIFVALLLLALGAGAGFFLMLRRAPAARDEPHLAPDAPLVIGDHIEMAVGSKNSWQSCSFDVMGLEADGRVLGIPCGGSTPAPIDRKNLRPESFQARDPGNIALMPGPGGWVRAEIIAPEPNDQLRVLPLGENTQERLIPKAEAMVVQRSGVGSFLVAPLPENAALEVGDVVSLREGVMVEEGKLLALGDTVRLERGSAYDGEFKSFHGQPKTASKKMLLARVVTVGTLLKTGDVLLGTGADASIRYEFVASEPHHLLRVTTRGGGERKIVKQGLYLVRVGERPAPVQVPDLRPPGIAALTPAFRGCYQSALATNPKAGGRVEVKLSVGAKGQITRVDVKSEGDLPASVANCVKDKAKGAKLDPPDGGGAVYVIPIVFQQAN